MNKVELIERVAVKTNLTKKAAGEIVETVFLEIINELKNNSEVKVAGFGSFEVKQVKGRIGVNPTTKLPIEIPSSKKVSFHASEGLKDIIK